MEFSAPLTEKSSLPNGCRLITIHTPGIPRVDMTVTVPAGGGHSPQLPGIAHALEHLVFKGPEGFTSEMFSKRLERTGGGMNAHTDREETVFKVSVPAPSLEIGLTTLSDITLRPALPAHEWEKERQVIIEEIGRRQDSPTDRLFDSAVASFFGEHPIGTSIAGSRASLEAMLVTDLQDFYKTHYDPAQMVVTVCSPFTHQEMEARLEAEGFGENRGQKRTRPLGRAVPPLVPQVIHTEHASNQLMTTFLCPGPSGENWEERMALQPVVAYLCKGQSSRLFQEAREKLGVAYDASGFLASYRANGIIGAYASTTGPKLAAFEEVVRREFAKVAQEGLRPDVLAEIKERSRGEVMMKAHLMGVHMAVAIENERYGGPATLNEQLAAMESLTPERVAEMAAKWYQPDRLSRMTLGTGVTLTPEIKAAIPNQAPKGQAR